MVEEVRYEVQDALNMPYEAKTLITTQDLQDKIKCHHTHRKNCFDTYITTYQPEKVRDSHLQLKVLARLLMLFFQEEVCSNEYQKSCFIQYEKVAKEAHVETCHQRLTRDCNAKGENVCTIEKETGT